MSRRKKLLVAVLGLAIVLACAVAAVLVAPGNARVQGTAGKLDGSLKGKHIVLVTYWLDNYGSALAGWTDRYVKARGGTLEIVDGKADAVAQMKKVDDAIVRRVDGIIWQPIDPGSSGPEIRKIQRARIPLVLFGSYQDPKVTHSTEPQVIIDDYAATFKSGQHAAQWITKHRRGQPPKVVAFDFKGNSIVARRTKGFVDGLKSVRKDTKVVFRDDVNTDSVSGRQKMQNIITATPDFNVLEPYAADVGQGAMSALRAAGRGKAVNKVPVSEWIVLIDGTPPQLQLLFDKKSSVMEVITITPRENALANLNALIGVISGKIKPTANHIVSAAGTILPADCRRAAAIFSREYSVVKAYKPLDCSKYR
jgi:ABC-type sugar transport system substrate-binding protein